MQFVSSCVISVRVAEKAVRDLTIRDHRKHWYFSSGLRQAKEFTQRLLNLNRDQLRWVAELLKGHCHLNGHLLKLGLVNSHEESPTLLQMCRLTEG
jgi:hypothetical protein